MHVKPASEECVIYDEYDIMTLYLQCYLLMRTCFCTRTFLFLLTLKTMRPWYSLISSLARINRCRIRLNLFQYSKKIQIK